MKTLRRLMLLLLLPAGLARADGASATFTVSSSPDHPVEVSVDQIKNKFADQIKPITFTSHGQSHTANAVPLLAVLKDAGVAVESKKDPNADPKTKNLPLRKTVIVTGNDGYVAAIALAELLPEFGNHPAYLALDDDGAPLQDKSAPVELILPDDVKPGRWVHGVASIVIYMPTPATNPATNPTTQP